MAKQSTIEWTENTWNPLVGCFKVSAGCKHCYAERLAKRLAAMARAAVVRGDDPGRLAHYTHVLSPTGRWNGRLVLDEGALHDPYTWKLPRLIFVNSMSDLFHDAVPLAFQQRVFAVMNDCPQHTFQVLTKRPDNAARHARHLTWSPNIWMGTSIERNDVTHRALSLYEIPAHVRFLSLEPLLGPLDTLSLAGCHWAIVGGESGPGARPMHERWALDLRNRCVAAGIPFFFKQWGGVQKKKAGRELDGRTWDEMPVTFNYQTEVLADGTSSR